MDLFRDKNIKPMLIGKVENPFDSPDYLFELKLDGERCLAYLDPEGGTALRSKRNVDLLPKVPELSDIHIQAKCRCILDGELIVQVGGAPSFEEIRRRSLTVNAKKIRQAAAALPSCYVAFDILYRNGREVMSQPLTERKKLLEETVTENERLVVSRCIEEHGVSFFRIAEGSDLEGIVAKKRDSLYVPDSRTEDWIRVKNLQDEDYIICGYRAQSEGSARIVLGQREHGQFFYRGQVALGKHSEDFSLIRGIPIQEEPPFESTPKGLEDVYWIPPVLTCTVQFMSKTPSGFLRHPVFLGISPDKSMIRM